jgi:hypothetical protein
MSASSSLFDKTSEEKSKINEKYEQIFTMLDD